MPFPRLEKSVALLDVAGAIGAYGRETSQSGRAGTGFGDSAVTAGRAVDDKRGDNAVCDAASPGMFGCFGTENVRPSRHS